MNGRIIDQLSENIPAGMLNGDLNRWWEILTQHMGSSIVVTSRDGRFLANNPAAQQSFDPRADNLIGRTWHDVLPADVADERLAITQAVLETGSPTALVGLIRGRCRCSIFRTANSHGPDMATVVVICHPLTAFDRQRGLDTANRCQVKIAECHDFGPLSELTEREFEVLTYIGEGLSTADIAKRLRRSAKTVEWHRGRLGAKLGAKNRVQLARIAIQAGLIHLRLLSPRLRVGRGS